MEQVYHARLMRHRERLNTTGCPSVCLLVFRQSVCRQNAKKTRFSKKTKQFTAIDDIWSRTCAFQRTHYWTPKIRVGGDPPSWKSWRHFVTATADVSGCSVWICGTCDAKASSYLGSGRMTEVIRVALHAKVLGPWDSDCAGGRLLSTDTGLADLLPLGVLNTSALSTISSCGSISIMSVIHSDE